MVAEQKQMRGPMFILGFVFQLAVLGRILLFTMLMIGIFVWFALANENMEGVRVMMGIPMLVAGLLMTTACVIFAMASWASVMRDSAGGHREISSWPAAPFIEHIGSVWQLGYPVAILLPPAAIMGYVSQYFLGSPFWGLIPVLTIGFPLLAFSLMETESYVNIF